MKIQIEIIRFPSRCMVTSLRVVAFTLYSGRVDSPLRGVFAGHAGNRVDQLAVGNIAVAIEVQPFALAPRGVVPARQQREILLALAHAEFPGRDAGER